MHLDFMNHKQTIWIDSMLETTHNNMVRDGSDENHFTLLCQYMSVISFRAFSGYLDFFVATRK